MHVAFCLRQLAIFCGIFVNLNAEPLVSLSGTGVVPPINGQLPFIALLTNDRGEHLCTGSLISEKHVLTAASCLDKISPTSNSKVVLGTLDTYSPIHRKFDVLSKITYKTWCEMRPKQCFYEGPTDDIGIILLKTKDTNTRWAMIKDSKNEAGFSMKIIGWGRDDGDVPSLKPRRAVMTVLSKEECEKRVKNLVHPCLSDVVLPKKVLCAAADPPVLVTGGDIGGPAFLMKDKYISGIIIQRCPAYSPNDVNAQQVNLILRLSDFYSFIFDVMRHDSYFSLGSGKLLN